eukprot:1292-Heterococcus_DN1.PRE.2
MCTHSYKPGSSLPRRAERFCSSTAQTPQSERQQVESTTSAGCCGVTMTARSHSRVLLRLQQSTFVMA